MYKAYYEIWTGDLLGRRNRLILDPHSIEVNQTEDGTGTFRVSLGRRKYGHLLNRQNRVWEIWRAIPGGLTRNLGVFFARGFDGRGDEIQIYGPDQNSLLGQYIVAYNADTPQSAKSGPAGNLILQYSRENFLTLAADPERDLSAFGVSIQGDADIGAALTKAASRRGLLSLYNSLRETSALAGQTLYCRLVPTGFDPIRLQLRVYPDRLGQDFTSQGKRPIVLSEEAGTLKDISFSIDYNQQVNAMYAGGGGQGVSRLTALVIDDTRVVGPFGRFEGWTEDTQILDADTLLDFAEEKLHANRPRLQMNASLAASPGLPFGVWGLGDVFDAVNALQLYHVRVRAVSIRATPAGETVSARLDGYQPKTFVGVSIAES